MLINWYGSPKNTPIPGVVELGYVNPPTDINWHRLRHSADQRHQIWSIIWEATGLIALKVDECVRPNRFRRSKTSWLMSADELENEPVTKFHLDATDPSKAPDLIAMMIGASNPEAGTIFKHPFSDLEFRGKAWHIYLVWGQIYHKSVPIYDEWRGLARIHLFKYQE